METIFNDVMDKNFQELSKDTNPHTEVQPILHIMKLRKNSDREEILQGIGEQREGTFKGAMISSINLNNNCRSQTKTKYFNVLREDQCAHAQTHTSSQSLFQR